MLPSARPELVRGCWAADMQLLGNQQLAAEAGCAQESVMPEDCRAPCRCTGGGPPPRGTDAAPRQRYDPLSEVRAAAAQEAGLKPDAVVYNALITLAGRTGQLQRAMDTVSRMEARPPLWKPA